MKDSNYKTYDDLPLFLNADTLAKALGVAPSSAYELMHRAGFPVLTYTSLDEAIQTVRSRPESLALYLFSSNKRHISQWKERISFGGGCINDTLIHLATSAMGFGGVGASGMGAYHGKRGFDTFTHYKSMVDKKTFLDLPMRYQPYTARKDKLIQMFLK